MPCFSYRFAVHNPSQSIEKSVTSRIYGKGWGSVFTPNDFWTWEVEAPSIFPCIA